MGKIGAILKISIKDRIIERSQVIFWLLLSITPLLVNLLIWKSIYSSGESIAGYSLDELTTYTFCSSILSWIRIQVHWRTSRDIASGKLNGHLLRPFRYVSYRFLRTVADRSVDILISIPAFLVLAIFLKPLILLPKTPVQILTLIALTIPLTITLEFFYTLCLGQISFWTLEAGGIFYLAHSLTSFTGGSFLPIPAFPKPWRTILTALPFQYFFSFPLNIYLGKIPPNEIFFGVLAQIFWVIALAALAKILWEHGLRKYGAYGG